MATERIQVHWSRLTNNAEADDETDSLNTDDRTPGIVRAAYTDNRDVSVDVQSVLYCDMERKVSMKGGT
jgi:hypothetical protein